MKLVLMFLGLASSVYAGTAPADYVAWTAIEKQKWHEQQAIQTAHAPGFFSSACRQGIALGGLGFKKFLEKTVGGGSGFPDDKWRELFGKPIHAIGVTVPAFWQLDVPLMGLPLQPIPVTLRYSEANPHLPYVPLAEHRPGILIMFHRDGQKDLNLFVMPSDGLRGFSRKINPFSIPYTHWLNQPGPFLRTLAALTFGRIVSDPYTQYLESNLESNFPPNEMGNPTRATASRIELRATSGWQARYDEVPFHLGFWDEMAELGLFDLTPLFDIFVSKDGTESRAGILQIQGSWRASKHGDSWFAEHKGFILR